MIFLSNKIQNVSDSHPPRSKIELLKFGFILEMKILQKTAKKILKLCIKLHLKSSNIYYENVSSRASQ